MKLKFVFVFALVSVALANPVARVEEQIWKNFEESDTTNVLITFKKANTKAAYDRFHSLKLTSREALLDTQHAILKDHADVVQADVIDMLKKGIASGKSHRLDQLWITTELIVRNIDKEFVEKLRNHPDVESLVAEQFFPILETVEVESFEASNNTILNQWGIVNVNAPAAWARGFQGAGITIGNTDTGVRHTHIYLAPTYRGNDPGEDHNYNWFAPNNNAAIPNDPNGHGTHCIGTHSGINGIGVAPQSRWISCRGCVTVCSHFDLNSCGNFMACPTNTEGGAPQCNRAPRIVSNSWGQGGGNPFYNPVLEAWRNVGIVGVFGIGNFAHHGCASAGSPGDQPLAFGVGGIAQDNTLSTFSSVGPGPNNAIKPDVAAPGTSVVSATHLADTGFRTLSGTSMACPHVSGALALIFQARPGLSVTEALESLKISALDHVSGDRNCEGRPEGIRPNNHVGYGRIDVNASI